MPQVVKIVKDHYGSKIKYAKWCLIVNWGGVSSSLCSGQVFGFGKSAAEFDAKEDGKIN